MLIPIHRPATVSPNTLRSLSSGSTFKPFSYTSQPTSLPFNNWQTTERRPTKSSLPFQFESPILTVPSSVRSSLKEEPMIDEAGYASLVSKQDPVYEPLRMELENREDLSGTQASKQVIDPAEGVLWFASKELQTGKILPKIRLHFHGIIKLFL